jgi:hypothetical protein
MNRRKAIIESPYEPPVDSLWLYEKTLKAFINGKWEVIGSGLSPEEIEELKTKVIVELEIGDTDEIKARNLEKLKAVQSVDHLFFADIDYGYGTAKWLPITGGEAFIITSTGNAVVYNIDKDGSVVKSFETDIKNITSVDDALSDTSTNPVQNKVIKQALDNLTLGQVEVLDLLSYGVSWKPEVADPVLTRVGNMSYHRTLPIQNNMRGCIAQMKGGVKIMYYLNNTDWRFRTPQDAKSYKLKDQVISFNGNEHTITNDVFSTLQYEHQYVKINDIICQVTSIDIATKTASITPEKALAAGSYDIELGAVLNGYDGEVMVEVPEFWIKSWDTDVRREVRISPSKIDDTWEHQPKLLVAAYHDTVLNTIPENMGYLSTLEANSALSIVNTNGYCRGGNNSSTYDAYITSDRFRSMLGKPRTAISRATMRASCRRSGKEILNYLQYKRVLYWLYFIEYANFNCQAKFNSELTSEGFRQGGLGGGVTTINSSYWNFYNSYNPLTPSGYTNEFGNGTNIKTMTIVMPTVSGGEPTFSTTQYVSRWHGIENPFGDIWNNVDGVIINSSSIVENGKKYSELYATEDPLLYSDSNYSKMRVVGIELNEAGYIKEWDLGNTAEIVPRLNGGNTTQYKCDYHFADNTTGLRTLFLGSSAYNGAYAGLGGFNSFNGVGIAYAYVGFRSSCVVA